MHPILLSSLRLFLWVGTLSLASAGMCSATALAAAPPPPEWHDFTNTSGQTIRAQIINVVEPDVQLQRDDKQSFKASITLFSTEDQAYIRAWALKQILAANNKIFRLTALDSKSSPKVTTPSGWVNTAWDASYKVTVENLSKVQLTDLKAAYIVFVKEVSWKGEESEAAHSGLSLVPPLAPGAKETLTTDGVGLRKQVVAPGFSSPELPKGFALDELIGIWIRIYGSDGKILQEWKSSEDKLKKFANSDSEALFKKALAPPPAKKR